MPNPTNIITTTLPDYVDQNREAILKEIVLDNSVIDYLSLQTGIKTKAAINYLGVDVVFQNGRGCGFNAQDSIELTQREIEVSTIKIEGSICYDTLLGKWAEWKVRTGAGKQDDDWAFAEEITMLILEDIKYKRDLAIWQGDTDIEITESSTSIDKAEAQMDGFLKKAEEEEGTITVEIPAGTTCFTAIRTVVAKLPRGYIKKSKIFVAPEFFTALVFELVDRNLFHYSGPQNEMPSEIVFPGTNLSVISQDGLEGVAKIYASQKENMFFGTDLVDDVETVEMEYDKKEQILWYRVKFTAGVEVAFPDRVVLATLAAMPAVDGVPTLAESVAKIAGNTGDSSKIVEKLGDIAGNTGASGKIVEKLGDIATNTGEDGALDSGLQEISESISGTEPTPDPDPEPGQ